MGLYYMKNTIIEGCTVEWDDRKNETNRKKHGISFFVAAYVFADEDSQAGNTFGSGTFDGTASIDSAFSNIDFDDFGSLGGLI